MAKSVDSVNKARDAGADDVLEAVHAVMHLYRSQQYRVLRDGPQTMTHLEGRVLAFFARRPGATQSELVARAGLDKGQLARLVAGLRARGLLEAQQDATDRRAQRLHLTAAGAQAHAVLHEQGRRVAEIAVQGLSDEERDQLARLLARMRGNLEGGGRQ